MPLGVAWLLGVAVAVAVAVDVSAGVGSMGWLGTGVLVKVGTGVGVAVGIIQVSVLWHLEHCPREWLAGRSEAWQDLQLV